jgi:hypothetical protein
MMPSVGLPRPLLEETLELVASLYCLLAMRQRAAGTLPVARPAAAPARR